MDDGLASLECDSVLRQASGKPHSSWVMLEESNLGVPRWHSGLRNQLVSMRIRVRSSASLSGFRTWCCHELQYRILRCYGSDPTLLWPCPGLAAAAPIQPLA